jgi:hypothetical protein
MQNCFKVGESTDIIEPFIHIFCLPSVSYYLLKREDLRLLS